jgi:hypothetical protein
VVGHSLAPPPDFLYCGRHIGRRKLGAAGAGRIPGTLLQFPGCVSGCWERVRGGFVMCCLAGAQQTRPAPEAAPDDGGLKTQWTSAVESSILAADSSNGQSPSREIPGGDR